jgi:hypothetical protein
MSYDVLYDVLYGTITHHQCGEAEGSAQDTWIHVHGGHAANAVWCPKRDSDRARASRRKNGDVARKIQSGNHQT